MKMAARAIVGSSTVLGNKGGYDYEFVSPPPKSLECPVCLLILRDPHIISCCGNEFCQVCIERVKRDGKPCPLCNEQMFSTMLHKKLVREVNALVVRCPQKELGCEWEGELGQVQGHLYPKYGVENGCDYAIVTCSYNCGMQLQRQELREHIYPKRPIGMQVASLLKRFDAIDAENRLLRQELDIAKKVHEKEMKKMKSTYEVEINQLRQELKQSQEAVKFEVSKTLKELKERCITLQSNKAPISLPPYYFTMINTDHYLEHNMNFYSAPFYSHPGGYKMNVSVRSNAKRGSGHSYFNLFVSILRGEFDDQLKWPFDGEVTVQAYNRTLARWDNEETILLNEQECDVDVVERQIDVLSSASWGCQQWLSFRDLKAHFVKDTSILRLRVVTVKVNSV